MKTLILLLLSASLCAQTTLTPTPWLRINPVGVLDTFTNNWNVDWSRNYIFFDSVVEETSNTQFGIVCGDCPDKNQAAKLLGINLIRTQISLNDYKGNDLLSKYFDSGNYVIATIKWADGVDTFVNEYRYNQKLDLFLSKNYNPKLSIVIGNEEPNAEGNYGNAQQYIGMLNRGVEVAEKYGVPISDGGITFTVLRQNVFIALMQANRWDYAEKYRAMVMTYEMRTHLQNPEYNNWKPINFVDSVLKAIKEISYEKLTVNLHYTPTSTDTLYDNIRIHEITDSCLSAWTGKIVIYGEMGENYNSYKLMRSEMRNALKMNIPQVIWRAGIGDGASVLFTSTYGLNTKGYYFNRFIKNNPQ